MTEISKQRPFVISDPLYTNIYLSDLLKQFLVKELQHLRGKYQLGMTRYVYNDAIHNRYQHSLGVCHLAGKYYDTLIEKSKYADAPWRMRMGELVRIAGLLHDAGHSILSHTFDYYIAPLINVPEHEVRSVTLLRFIVSKYQIAITEDEVNLIEHMIIGKPLPQYPRFLFQIVANNDFDLDVDKIDYLMRDSHAVNIGCPIQHERIFNFARIIDDSIQFHEKIAPEIETVFTTRYHMHEKVYQHPKVLAFNVIAVEILKYMAIKFEWQSTFQTIDWIYISDHIIDDIPYYYPDDQILMNLHDKLYDRKSIRLLNNDEAVRLADDSSVRCVHRSIGMTSKCDNPFNKILFYTDNGESKHISLPDINSLFSGEVFKKQDLYFQITSL